MEDAINEDTVMVFSGKSLETLVKEGGCGHWRLDKSRAARCRYVVVVRNLRAEWSEEGFDHGTAWLVGTIAGFKPADEGRWLIELDEYALIELPNKWTGSRYPVAYTTLSELGINIEDRRWLPFPARPAQAEGADEGPPQTLIATLLDDAKTSLAASLGLRANQVEITIRA